MNIAKARTGKERFWFVILLGISLVLWFFLFRSLVRSVTSFAPIQNLATVCFERDSVSERFLQINRKLLFRGEECYTIDDVPQDAREEIIESQGITAANTKDIFSFSSVLVLIILLGIVSFILTLGHIRMNSIRISQRQFPKLYKAIGELSEKLGLEKQPDVFVMMGNGVLNAFAAKLFARKVLVVYSDLAEALIEGSDQDQLEAVLAHELGHHALFHTSWWLWVLEPAMFIPFIGAAYSRAREYSADRVMSVLVPNQKACERALMKLVAGKKLGQSADIDAFVQQAEEEAGFFPWLSEKVSTHPHLAHRILAIRTFAFGQ